MNHNNQSPTIIAVIPCLNEERFIGGVVARAVKYVNKVIVVDDGSSDNTSQAATQAGAEVIRHPASRGAGAATKTGLEASLKLGADIIVTLDGDNQHDPDEIPNVLKPFANGEADLVIGSRFLKEACVPFFRKLGIDLITGLYNAGHKEKIVDGQSGFRAYNRRAAEAMNITYPGFGFSIQTLVQARKKGLKIAEAPISCIYHDAGSTEHPFVHGLTVALAVIKIRMREEFFKTGKS
ncbi:MAG: glycosyltransferase family 2 protein [Dehalococcoidia bacterium]|jgi:glycosyltransferase involved in cell wall biosynthesis